MWYRYCIDCIPCNAFPIALVCILFLSCTDCNRLVYRFSRELAVRVLRPRHHTDNMGCGTICVRCNSIVYVGLAISFGFYWAGLLGLVSYQLDILRVH